VGDNGTNSRDFEGFAGGYNKTCEAKVVAMSLVYPIIDADMINDAANRYLIEPPLKFYESRNCFLDWWKINGGHFPQVAVFGETIYLCIPPTSVLAERIFYSYKSIDMIIFLSKNLFLLHLTMFFFFKFTLKVHTIIIQIYCNFNY